MRDIPKVIRDDYAEIKELPNGDLAGIAQMLFTTGLFVGLDEVGYKRRYCYPSWIEASTALKYWNGEGDPLGNWIVEKPSGRQGPGSNAPTG